MSTMSMDAARGRNVIAVDTAEDIGEVKSFVVNRRADAIEKIHIAGRKKNAMFASWDDLESFGDDAVMVSSTEAPAEADTDRETEVARGNIDLLGARILDTAGFEHGTVVDAEFDSGTGAIVSVTNGTGETIAADEIESLGSYALVVRH